MSVRPSTVAALAQAGAVVFGFLIVNVGANGTGMPSENGLGYAVPGIVHFARDFGWVFLSVPLGWAGASWELERRGHEALSPLLGWGVAAALFLLFAYAVKRILIYP